MKLIYAALFVATPVFAAGPTCYDLATPVKVAIEADAPETNLKLNAKVCVSATDEGKEDETTLRTKGRYRIEITNAAGKRVALYKASVLMADGALGSVYYTYAGSDAELDKSERGDFAEVVQFRLLNDKIKKGEWAGRLTVQGTDLSLLAR